MREPGTAGSERLRCRLYSSARGGTFSSNGDPASATCGVAAGNDWVTTEAAAAPLGGSSPAPGVLPAVPAAAADTTAAAVLALATPAGTAGSGTTGSASATSTAGASSAAAAPSSSGDRGDRSPTATVAACRVAGPATHPALPLGTSATCGLLRLGVRGVSSVLAAAASWLRADRGALGTPTPSLTARDERAVLAFADRTREPLNDLASRTTSLASIAATGGSAATWPADGDVASCGCLPPPPPPPSSPPLPAPSGAAAIPATAVASSVSCGSVPPSSASTGAVPPGGSEASGSADRGTTLAGPLITSGVGAPSTTATVLGGLAAGIVAFNDRAATCDGNCI